jgi:hypothetical protein
MSDKAEGSDSEEGPLQHGARKKNPYTPPTRTTDKKGKRERAKSPARPVPVQMEDLDDDAQEEHFGGPITCDLRRS